MLLREIYRPIEGELIKVEKILKMGLRSTRNKSILEIGGYLLADKGKRLRPALVILCAKAASDRHSTSLSTQQLTNIAASVELIHAASLIHDDVIDHANMRHNKSTVNNKWGNDVSIALGDYFYSIAFGLISTCGNTDILHCISSATKSMCEGELIQVCERDNLDLLKEHYILIVKKKTASLFAASCQSGAMLFHCQMSLQNTLKQYGLNFGIAFQIIDDCLDLVGKARDLGKSPGADLKMGELTLPLLNLISQSKDKKSIMSLIRQQENPEAFVELRQRFINSQAFLETKHEAVSYIRKAKESLNKLRNSCFKQNLFSLADYITERMKADD